MTGQQPELFRTTEPPTMRPGIDLAKLARLQIECQQLRAVVHDTTEQAHWVRGDIQHAISFFPASPGAYSHWREGDPVEVFLQLPAKVAADFPAEVRAAKRIAQLRADLTALNERAQALNERYATLARLVAACEAYAQAKD